MQIVSFSSKVGTNQPGISFVFYFLMDAVIRLHDYSQLFFCVHIFSFFLAFFPHGTISQDDTSRWRMDDSGFPSARLAD